MTVEDPQLRTAGRAIVRGADGRLLMIRGEDPAEPGGSGFWFTPGGGVEGDETIEEATRRELLEEIGLEVGDLGPVVMQRVSFFRFDTTWYRQEEDIHLVRAPEGFEPRPQSLVGIELAAITDMRWVTVDELEALGEPHYPVRLAELIRHVDRDGAPDPPWREVSDGR